MTVAFSPPAPGATAAATPRDASARDARVGDMNFTIQEWDNGRIMRILVGTPSLEAASAAYEAAVKLTRKRVVDRPSVLIEYKNGSRLMDRYPPKGAGERASPAAE